MADQLYFQSRLRKKAEHRPFDFHSYMSLIQQHTFKSVVVPVDVACAKAIVSYYQQRYNSRHGALSNNDIEQLYNLRKRITEAIDKEFDGGPVFCRMTNRSPKDGEPRDLEKLSHLYRQQLRELEEQERLMSRIPPTESSPSVWSRSNMQMVAASSAQLQMLRCEKAHEVMDLLLSSERVFVDTLLALDCASADSNDEWSTCLILREWNEKVRGDWEFRLFVYEGDLTAVSQYNHYCIFPELNIEVDENSLKNEIVTYWKEVRECITFSNSYVVDIVKLSDGTWKVIELNPYATTTGGALFDWDIDRDILHGKSYHLNDGEQKQFKPELRIRHEPYRGLEDLLEVVMLPFVSGNQKPFQSGPWEQFLAICV